MPFKAASVAHRVELSIPSTGMERVESPHVESPAFFLAMSAAALAAYG